MAHHVSMKTLRVTLLSIIGIALVMLGGRLFLDPQLLGMPRGLQSALETASLLTLYALVVIGATRGGHTVDPAVVRVGTALGLAAGTLEITHITLENYGQMNARLESFTTGGFLLGLLLLWGVAGYCVTRRTGGLGSGLLAGSWSAMVGMLMAVTYGISQLFWDLPRLEERNIESPDFLRSGWTDLHAFTITDVFEAGFKVLLVGPIAGALLGGIAAFIAWILRGARDGKPS